MSKSPWNLYAPLVEYLEVQGLPLGPLVLRDFGLRMKKNHKAEAIEAILRTYPALRFILSEPAVSTVIPGMRSLRNVERNVAASDAGPLPAEQRERLRAHRWVRNFYE